MPDVNWQTKTKTRGGECRRCSVFCDKMIDPRSCAVIRCAYLYSYAEERTNAVYMGCMHGIFRAEVDVELYGALARRGRTAGLKVAREPYCHCPFTVEKAHRSVDGDASECRNLRFHDCNDRAPGGFIASEGPSFARPDGPDAP